MFRLSARAVGFGRRRRLGHAVGVGDWMGRACEGKGVGMRACKAQKKQAKQNVKVSPE